MVQRRVKSSVLAIAFLWFISDAQPAPTTPQRAEAVVRGWLTRDRSPLTANLRRQIDSVETYSSDQGDALYHVVALKPSGFVIVAGDDLAEPIIAFADTGRYDPDTDNPLRAMVSRDVPGRVISARGKQAAAGTALPAPLLKAQSKWKTLSGTSEVKAAASLGVIDDPRVLPLLETKWGQSTTTDGQYCYNYYTPNHYLVGCGATALAQILRYHRYPHAGVGVRSYSIQVDGSYRQASTRGGDGLGGPYAWEDMVAVPDDGITDQQRQAIGALCHDVGVALGTNYGADGSGSYTNRYSPAFKSTFGYGNANGGWNGFAAIDPDVLVRIINPNLDAGYPVLLGTAEATGHVGHETVCDGYGYYYNTLYHHINFGWTGTSDAWYNIPDFSSVSGDVYKIVSNCDYNIFPEGSGEIISGRVTTISQDPISSATVTATTSSGATYETTTNDRGIYALAKIPAATQYTISVAHASHSFPIQRNVTTGTSPTYGHGTGNVWGVDFIAEGPAPVAKDIELIVQPGTTVQISLAGFDDGLPDPPGALVYTIVALPSAGTLSDPGGGTIDTVPYTLVTGGKVVTYISPSSQSSTVTFQYLVNDGGTAPHGGDSNVATVSIRLAYVPSGVLYVDKRATGSGNGLTWNNAYHFLQDALTLAAASGESIEIHVAQGVQYPDEGATVTAGDTRATFNLLNGVTLRGGYAGVGALDPDAHDTGAWETVLSGDLNGDDGPDWANIGDNSYCVVRGTDVSSSAIIEGFTIAGGHAILSCQSGRGAGIHLSNSSPIIRHCTIRNNFADYAGGISCENGGHATVEDCLFTANFAASVSGAGAVGTMEPTGITLRNCNFVNNHARQAGAVYLWTGDHELTGCTFRENSSDSAAGALVVNTTSLVVTDCTFISNTALRGGGAVYLWTGDVVLRGCTFRENSSPSYGGLQGDGGAIALWRTSPTLIDCTFIGNTAADKGGAICNYELASPIVVNCLFVGNSAVNGGGAIDNFSQSNPTLINCTVVGNSTPATGGGMHSDSNSSPTVRNSIFWGNSQQGAGALESAQIYLDGGIASVAYSCIQDNDPEDGAIPFGGSTYGNIDDNPRFVDPDSTRLQLRSGSPCIDAGDNAAVTPGLIVDLAGKPRFTNGPDIVDTGSGTPPIVDMGAYEHQPSSPADFDEDGDVDADDLAIFESCATGPAIPYDPAALPEPGCTLTPDDDGRTAADFDADADVDQADFGVFQQCFSGDQPADPACVN